MAPTQTTTLRVPVELRDEIAALAEDQGTTLLEVVTRAVAQLKREQFWEMVHQQMDAMPADELSAYQAETNQLDGTVGDGLRDI